MNVVNYRVTLDMLATHSQTTIKAKKGDSACKIKITLTKNGKVFKLGEGCSAKFCAKKSDGNFVRNDCTVDKDTIIYDFATSIKNGVCQLTAAEGDVDCEVIVYDANKKQLTSSHFTLYVDSVVYNGEEILSSSYVDVLEEFEEKLNNGEFKGEPGRDGRDGTSVTHTWNGTKLKVTSASGTSSADLKGDKGDKGDPGIRGPKGETGDSIVCVTKKAQFENNQYNLNITNDMLTTNGGCVIRFNSTPQIVYISHTYNGETFTDEMHSNDNKEAEWYSYNIPVDQFNSYSNDYYEVEYNVDVKGYVEKLVNGRGLDFYDANGEKKLGVNTGVIATKDELDMVKESVPLKAGIYQYTTLSQSWSYLKNTLPDAFENEKIVSKLQNGVYSSYFEETLGKLVIGSDITEIGNYAFYNCKGLTSVVIPDSVTSIGANAFRGCTSLKSITIGDSVTSIGDRAFYNCSTLTSITIPEDVEEIKTSTFEDCTSLSSVDIPTSVKTIGNDAFGNCNRDIKFFYKGANEWTSISVGEGNTLWVSQNVHIQPTAKTINKKVIAGKGIDIEENDAEEKLVISVDPNDIDIGDVDLSGYAKKDYVDEVADALFLQAGLYDENDELTKDWATLKKEYTDAFDGNKIVYNPETEESYFIAEDLRGKLVIGDEITEISNNAFSGCSFSSVVIPDSVTNIGVGAFSWNDMLEKVVLSNNIITIPTNCFSECVSLSDIVIPDSVTSIGVSAFYDCDSLASITIPNSVTSIGEEAFRACTSLENVYYEGTEQDWQNIDIGMNQDWAYSGLRSAVIHYEQEMPKKEVDYNTNLATKKYVDKYVKSAIKLKLRRVTLPADKGLDSITNPDIFTIYMVKSDKSEEQNVYDEYFWTGSDWECIGSTKVDLSEYQKKLTADRGIDITDNTISIKLGSGGLKIDSTGALTLGTDDTLKVVGGGPSGAKLGVNTDVVATKEYVNEQVGDVETALDSILAMQDAMLGGDA